jgi:hypothetical protein
MKKKAIDRFYSVGGVVLLLVFITVLRIGYLSINNFDLFYDEAQYWFWSKNPALGYYSKPPMVAWFIALTTSVCGDGEFCVRLSSPILHLVTTFVVYFIAVELFPKQKESRRSINIPFYAAITYITLPAVSVSSALVSTDPSLIMYWALSMLFFIKATKTNQMRWWILLGISGGLGMLSKYNMLLFAVSAVLYLAFSKNNRKYFTSSGLWLTVTIATAIFLPNVVWNMQNNMVSFTHTEDNATGSGIGLYPLNMLGFIGAQFGVFGPILFGVLLWILFRKTKIATSFKERKRNENKIIDDDVFKLLILFILPLFGMITVISLLSRAHANWAAPIYISATLLVVGWLASHHRRRLLNASLSIHLSAALIMFVFPYLDKLHHVEFNGSRTYFENGDFYINDPLKRLYGWSELGRGVTMAMNAYPDAYLLTDQRKVHAELLYYVTPHPFDAVKWNPTAKLSDHFDLTTNINKINGKNFLFVTASATVAADMLTYFESAEKVGNVSIRPYEDYSKEYYIYYLQGFKGY